MDITTAYRRPNDRALLLFHRTHEGPAIVRDGFHDLQRLDRVGESAMGVLVSDVPLGISAGEGESTIAIEMKMSEEGLAAFEISESAKTYREWLLPAYLLSRFGNAELITEERTDSFLLAVWHFASWKRKSRRYREECERATRRRRAQWIRLLKANLMPDPGQSYGSRRDEFHAWRGMRASVFSGRTEVYGDTFKIGDAKVLIVVRSVRYLETRIPWGKISTFCFSYSEPPPDWLLKDQEKLVRSHDAEGGTASEKER